MPTQTQGVGEGMMSARSRSAGMRNPKKKENDDPNVMDGLVNWAFSEQRSVALLSGPSWGQLRPIEKAPHPPSPF